MVRLQQELIDPEAPVPVDEVGGGNFGLGLRQALGGKGLWVEQPLVDYRGFFFESRCCAVHPVGLLLWYLRSACWPVPSTALLSYKDVKYYPSSPTCDIAISAYI